MNKDRCEYCDGTVEEVVTRVPFHYRRETIYVDNVPVRRCDKCGELYFPAKVYKELERIASGRKRIRSQISFPLADYRKMARTEAGNVL
jgi:YgiT-type zinc finger domain-containing protein